MMSKPTSQKKATKSASPIKKTTLKNYVPTAVKFKPGEIRTVTDGENAFAIMVTNCPGLGPPLRQFKDELPEGVVTTLIRDVPLVHSLFPMAADHPPKSKDKDKPDSMKSVWIISGNYEWILEDIARNDVPPPPPMDVLKTHVIEFVNSKNLSVNIYTLQSLI